MRARRNATSTLLTLCACSGLAATGRSICRRRGHLLAFFPRSALTLRTPEADIASYTFNRHAIRHRFCANCGCGPFGEGVDPKSGEATVAVNVRCLPDVDLVSLKVVPFDGASL